MDLNKDFFQKMIAESKQEQDMIRIRHARQDGVIAFCEMILKSLEEGKPDEHI